MKDHSKVVVNSKSQVMNIQHHINTTKYAYMWATTYPIKSLSSNSLAINCKIKNRDCLHIYLLYLILFSMHVSNIIIQLRTKKS